jgi:aspartokinase
MESASMHMRRKESIAEVVRRIIASHPSIVDCICLNIVNFSALSRSIMEEVRKASNLEKTDESAVKMAIIRFSETLKRRRTLNERMVRYILANSSMRLEMDVTVITAEREAVLRNVNEIMEKAASARFFQLTQGTRTFTLAIAREASSNVVNILSRGITYRMDDQAAIILVSPEEIINTPGVVSYITSILAWNGINISQIISCHTDTILIVSKDDAIRAYNVLDEIILRLRSGQIVTNRTFDPS